MEAVHSSRSSVDEAEYVSKLEMVENATSSSDPHSITTAKGESSAHQTPRSQESIATKAEIDDVAMVLRRKVKECGLWDMRVPELQMPECSSDGQETESDESDDDLCSSSDDDCEESFDPLASAGVMPPVLPDIQLRVPMEDANDVRRVKEALLIKGVLDVVCDEERQMVTVTGVVPPIRLLKKVRKVKRQARIISTASPLSMFVNPNTTPSSHFAVHEDPDSAPIDIPSAHPGIPNFVVRQQRPRPAFQRYNFHNDPHSPYLRTFSPTDLSPPASSPSPVTAHHSRFDSPSLDDDSYQANQFILT